MALWLILLVFFPLILAITALVVSLKTRRQLKEEVSRLQALLLQVQFSQAQQKTPQPRAPFLSTSTTQNQATTPTASKPQMPEAAAPLPATQAIAPPEDTWLNGLPASEHLSDHSEAVTESSDIASSPLSTASGIVSDSTSATTNGWPNADRINNDHISANRIGTRSNSHANTNLEPDEHSLNIVTSVWHSFLQWFKGGNAIVRVGVIILLVGIVLLLRLANELFTIPIEVRLGAVAVGGVALTLIGLKLRQKRRSYAISLQGAGLAIVYFTLFAAYRLYEILPPSLAFALLAILAVVSATFALMQNALPLALLAFGGGFLAPLLTSTGSNNLVGLFSYYLLLNVALAWLAHYKTWKVLNVLGAFMTFGMAGYLGWMSYETDMRWPLEGLLLAHLALYLFIVVRYSQQLVAAQQALPLENQATATTVDSTLLFGVPLMGFALQAGLMRDIPYALALSSAILSGIYLALGYRLFYKNKQLQLLTEGVLALSIGFMALVIPLALDATWTAVGWAVQGTALVWLGQRQNRIWSVRFGILLQVLSACVLGWLYLKGNDLVLPLMVYSACLFICAVLLRPSQSITSHSALDANFVDTDFVDISSVDSKRSDALFNNKAYGSFKFIIQPSFLMLVWSFIASQFMLVELQNWVTNNDYYWPVSSLELGIYPLIFGFVSLLIGWRFVWPQLSYFLKLLLGIVTLYAGLLWLDYYPALLDDKLLLLGLIAGYGLFGYLLLVRYQRQQVPVRIVQAMFALGLLVFSSVWWLINWSAEPEVAGIILPLVILAALIYFKPSIAGTSTKLMLHDLSIPVGVALWVWMIAASQQASGQLLGLPYIPFLNLLDFCLIAAGVVLYYLINYLPNTGLPYAKRGAQAALGIAGFMALTGMIVRTLHQWAGTPLWLDGAWYNDLVQTSLTIVWTLGALLLTGLASKYAWREVWLVGIVLLVIVVAKLLFIDLSNAATVARIVSFIGAGLIMLLIGYIAPLPPATSIKTKQPDEPHQPEQGQG